MWQILERAKVVPLLENSLATGRLHHAYLLVGPAHVGKMTLAVNLAQALNCEETFRPCGECAACRKIANGKHADVQVTTLAQARSGENRTKEISIEQIREIQHSSSLPPYEGQNKVFIIDGAELLSNEAANCLLKTLEEPADRVTYMLLTTNERLLPATVVSRCQKLELLPLATVEIENFLAQRWGISPAKARLLARLSHGCVGWAVTAAQNEPALLERQARIQNIMNVIESDNEPRFAYANQLALRFNQSRQVVQEELELWQEWWRDVLLVKTACEESIVNIDFVAGLKRQAEKSTILEIRSAVRHIQEAMVQLKQNAIPRLVLEMLMLDIPGGKI